MNSPVAVLREEETVERVMMVLDTIAHSGFPVVDEYELDAQETAQNEQGETTQKEDGEQDKENSGNDEVRQATCMKRQFVFDVQICTFHCNDNYTFRKRTSRSMVASRA